MGQIGMGKESYILLTQLLSFKHFVLILKVHFVPFTQNFAWDKSHNHICSASSGLIYIETDNENLRHAKMFK
jgi:hypothetical protein